MKSIVCILFVLILSMFFSQSSYVKMTDSSFTVNDVIKLRKPIHFIFCNAWSDQTLDDTSQIILDELATFLNTHKKITIEIGVHRDSRGTTILNDTMSKNNAILIQNLLIKKGVDSSQMTIHGYGESNPIAVYQSNGLLSIEKPKESPYELLVLDEAFINQFKKNDKKRFEELHAMNRRTEIKIIRINK